MRPSETQNSINLELILIFFCVFSSPLVFKSNFTPFRENHPSPILETHVSSSTCPATEEQLTSSACPSLLFTPTCTKTPPSLAQALVHYATLNVTPQQTFNEISVTSRVLQKKAPCNFLVFGLGHDSLM
ncbi:Glucuronoxylan 4-O-methyltransferase 2 [Vitis vinifera]|uniref:Glucuronoxylan 4-O-methyltransferase 2 n=1 Tax=Vitis vinifera TaxID=29760 RepID=A0A438FJ80_VITVI|nr:Glucuronoxylan 4-O-methyltransferase 2 [Vitis vinifera]